VTAAATKACNHPHGRNADSNPIASPADARPGARGKRRAKAFSIFLRKLCDIRNDMGFPDFEKVLKAMTVKSANRSTALIQLMTGPTKVFSPIQPAKIPNPT